MKNIFISLLIFLTFLFAIGCNRIETQVIGKGDADVADDIRNIGTVAFGFTADAWGTDAYTINAATLRDGTLTINVSYGGGCETHEFTLVAEERFLESFPVGPILKAAPHLIPTRSHQYQQGSSSMPKHN